MTPDIPTPGTGPKCEGALQISREPPLCPTCKARLVEDALGEHCPVCALRIALRDNTKESEESLATLSDSSVQHRFAHYELVLGQDGAPIELGRGAMGITYKAFDVDLRCTVTLKFVGEIYVGEETARLRFLREARAAASVRHPNVASVLYLGKSGGDYFYAMEFVEGETLEALIERSGRLDVKLALDIVTQISAGLAAVHKQKLVHRDIKPSNIMVNFEEGGAVAAKIIDLGLAKITESGFQTEISMPGRFAGTPKYASPEQFAGLGVDIRSDLYSLGIVLWEMLTGRSVFLGSPAEVMYQHQHAPLPLQQLQEVPQPVVALLQVLLEKNPKRRFQNPAELLKAMATITNEIGTGRRVTRHALQKSSAAESRTLTRRPTARLGPKKISVARLPATESDVFGREEDIAFLDNAWANQYINVVTIVAWAGVGKSTLVNHWLRRMASEHYRSAQLVFGWSFYRQGSGGGSSSADEFLDAALNWFGDKDPRLGTGWEKGERLAKLIAHRRTLLILDGLEPLQNPPGPNEGRLREASLQALLRELAAFNRGLCVITGRLPVADIADYERTSARRLDLEHLSSEAGAKLLRTLGVKGHQSELRSASAEFTGHCLALTLLGSYLTDAYGGDIRRRGEVSEHLAHDARQGVHARKVMESYQTWFGDGPELSVLRMLGLFDRPADEKVLRALLKPPAIRGLTESLADLSPTEWQTILGKLRRARLLAVEDPNNPRHLDAHPLVREFFGEQLRSQQTDAWKECSRRLYDYYRTLAPGLPDSFREMEPLFLAVICGCNAGLYREALHEVYIARIQRGEAYFAARVLGARGALLSALANFFEHGRLGSLAEGSIEGQGLTAEDHLLILLQTAQYMTDTRGFGAPEARICYEHVESLCILLNRPLIQFSALNGLWRHSLVTDKLSATLQIAKRIYALAEEQDDSALMIAAYRALALTLYYLGDFEAARHYATRGVHIWRLAGVPLQETAAKFPSGHPVVACLNYEALCNWHQQNASYQGTMAEAAALAEELNDMHALAMAQWHAGFLAYFERDPVEVERHAWELIQLATRHNFAYWLAAGVILRGWARSISGDPIEGFSWIEDGIADYSATGATIGLPFFLAIKAEVLQIANRTAEALEAIRDAETLAERSEERWWRSELYRLRGVLLAASGAQETQIEASFSAAINTAKQQASVSLTKRAEETYAEYRRRKQKP